MAGVGEQHNREIEESGQRRRRLARAAAGAAALVVVIVFVAENAQPVKVRWWFYTGHPRLIFVIVGCLAVGAAFGAAVVWPRRRARRRR